MTLPSMKKFLCKGIVSVTLACAAVPTATHAQELRQTILINDGWTFAFADDTARVAVALPHTWNADDPLCQHQLTGLDSYHISVVPGRYEVELTWADLAAPEALSAYLLGRGAETSGNAITKTDVAINGSPVEDTFAPSELSGVRAMVKRRYHTEVSGNEGIIVTFTPVDGGNTSLSAIKIRKLQ